MFRCVRPCRPSDEWEALGAALGDGGGGGGAQPLASLHELRMPGRDRRASVRRRAARGEADDRATGAEAAAGEEDEEDDESDGEMGDQEI